jgi:23S rRNA pseudouridine955/2504/2580 synthase
MAINKIEIDVPQELQNIRLDKFLLNIFPNTSYSNLQKLIRKKDIRINGTRTEANHKLNLNDIISIPEFIYNDLKNSSKKAQINQKKSKISERQIKDFKKNIIYKDENIIAINKPQGLAVQGGSNIKISIADFLPYLRFNNQQNPKLVHRIDKNTSGLLLIARNTKIAEKLTKLFKEKEGLTKTYLAIVIGKLPKNTGIISHPLIKKFSGGIEKVYKDNKLGKEAITKFKVLSYSQKYDISLVEVRILTGRTHQIRVHFKEFGHPILGDGKYGGKKAFIQDLNDSMHLHSYKIEIRDLKIKLKADFPLKFLKTIRKTGLKFK